MTSFEFVSWTIPSPRPSGGLPSSLYTFNPKDYRKAWLGITILLSNEGFPEFDRLLFRDYSLNGPLKVRYIVITTQLNLTILKPTALTPELQAHF